VGREDREFSGTARTPFSIGNRSAQNPAYRGPADPHPTGDFGFADAGAVQFSDFRSVDCRGRRSSQPFPVLSCVNQACPGSFPQDLPFELGEDREQPGHSATGGRGQIQRLGSGDKADAQMLEFLQRYQQIRYRAAPTRSRRQISARPICRVLDLPGFS